MIQIMAPGDLIADILYLNQTVHISEESKNTIQSLSQLIHTELYRPPHPTHPDTTTPTQDTHTHTHTHTHTARSHITLFKPHYTHTLFKPHVTHTHTHTHTPNTAEITLPHARNTTCLTSSN